MKTEADSRFQGRPMSKMSERLVSMKTIDLLRNIAISPAKASYSQSLDLYLLRIVNMSFDDKRRCTVNR